MSLNMGSSPICKKVRNMVILCKAICIFNSKFEFTQVYLMIYSIIGMYFTYIDIKCHYDPDY